MADPDFRFGGQCHMGLVRIALVLFPLVLGHSSAAQLGFSKTSINIVEPEIKRMDLFLSQALGEDLHVEFLYFVKGHFIKTQTQEMITPIQPITFVKGSTQVAFEIQAVHVGSVVVAVNSSSTALERLNEVYLTVYVIHSYALNVVGDVMGWGFFVAWALCIYPLVYTILKTKSFAGVSYGFVSLCAISFWAYAVYSCSLYFNEAIIGEYRAMHVQGVQPVQLQDVCLVVHFSFWFAVLSILCCVFESGGQKASKATLFLVAGFGVYAAVDIALAAAGVLTWLECMYGLALIKMITMPLKYMPQVWQNYQRKSTEGFNVLFPWLDFIGGTFTIAHMFVLALNGDDWSSFYGNLPKLFLGVASVVFDMILLVQHHVLYEASRQYGALDGESEEMPVQRK